MDLMEMSDDEPVRIATTTADAELAWPLPSATPRRREMAAANEALRRSGGKLDTAREQWLAIRREAGLKIDPETAEDDWTYAQTLDPYGVVPDLPEECEQIGREYFARSPDSDIWVHFSDLPEATSEALWKKHRQQLAFPAGLPIDELLEARLRS
jgi:hypothetical protein